MTVASPPETAPRARPTSATAVWALVGACLVIAAFSLLLPSEPSYDPMAWLIWGREIANFNLDTSGGPSWKPLPVLFTTLIAPLWKVDHQLPIALWMVVARAGALLALVMAFRLASRLAGFGVAGVLAGAVAVGALILTPDWFQFTAHGSEAPMAIALMFWAIERHLDGKPAHALVLGTLTCLLRPELFPFLALYGIWAWFARPQLRLLLIGAFVVLPLAWLVPEWIGSGNPFDGEDQARSQPVWSISLADQPWLRALERAHNHTGRPIELLALLAVAVAVLRRHVTVIALGIAAVAELALYVAMTQAGFSGNPRYVLPALAIACVLAGVGAANAAQALPLAFKRPTLAWRLAGVAVTVAALAALANGFVDWRVGKLRAEARQVGVRMEIHEDLAEAVKRVGGPNAVAAIGTATTNRALHTRLAWELEVPTELVESVTAHRVIFRSKRVKLVDRVFMTGRAKTRTTLAQVGRIRVYRRDGITFPLADRSQRTDR
jgi:hypothetical protein